jgi:hypothetical protein
VNLRWFDILLVRFVLKLLCAAIDGGRSEHRRMVIGDGLDSVAERYFRRRRLFLCEHNA